MTLSGKSKVPVKTVCCGNLPWIVKFWADLKNKVLYLGTKNFYPRKSLHCGKEKEIQCAEVPVCLYRENVSVSTIQTEVPSG